MEKIAVGSVWQVGDQIVEIQGADGANPLLYAVEVIHGPKQFIPLVVHASCLKQVPLSRLDELKIGLCSCGKIFDRRWVSRREGVDAENGPCADDPIDHAYQDECEECQDAAYYAADEGRDA